MNASFARTLRLLMSSSAKGATLIDPAARDCESHAASFVFQGMRRRRGRAHRRDVPLTAFKGFVWRHGAGSPAWIARKGTESTRARKQAGTLRPPVPGGSPLRRGHYRARLFPLRAPLAGLSHLDVLAITLLGDVHLDP